MPHAHAGVRSFLTAARDSDAVAADRLHRELLAGTREIEGSALRGDLAELSAGLVVDIVRVGVVVMMAAKDSDDANQEK